MKRNKNTIPSVQMDDNRFDKDTKPKSLSSIKKLYEQTFLDGSFQRWGGIDYGSGWSAADGRDYLREVLSGSVFNKIILADVERCLQWAESEGDQESIKYFQTHLKKGWKYISIDGNNTSSMISAFLKNHEELYFEDGNGNKKYFKDFNEHHRDDICHEKVLDVVFLRRIGITEMCRLFRKLNKSTHLNDQERRQARVTGLSKFIRDIANQE